ncbi:MAG: hypothetical protein FJW27_06215 [Acidimicrobiia bacterium]|nr:hypothetical protein [Acidimicrobiia bacterium]
MTRIALSAVIGVLSSFLATPLFAQSGTEAPPPVRTISLDGPRFGFTMLSEGVRAKLLQKNLAVEPMISQFGWQFERQFFTKDSGVTAMTEWVALIGGLDQGTPIPSLNWLVGLRTREGAEFGIGPNVTPAGLGLTLAAGVTFKTGALNVPMNFAVVPSRSGTRVSILTGFTMRR